ncbi:hypothetical protein BJX76DRAFT_139658 [Aspergillus varians]
MSDKPQQDNTKGKETIGVSGTAKGLQQRHPLGTSAKDKREANKNERAMRMLGEEFKRFRIMTLLSALEFMLELLIIHSFIRHVASIDGCNIPRPVPRHELKRPIFLFKVVILWPVCNKARFDLLPKYISSHAPSSTHYA